jgi:hypothetical protein
MTKPDKRTGRRILLAISILCWMAWAGMEFIASNVDSWKWSARHDLTALKRRVGIAPGSHVVGFFHVQYDARHYVGLAFDDKGFTDSLSRYVGWYAPPDFDIRLNWTLYHNNDSLIHLSFNRPTAAIGGTLGFGAFFAITGTEYKLELNIDSMPALVAKDSAWLDIGVDEATVSVGNEFGYGMLGAAANFLRIPTLCVAAILSLVTVLIWLRYRSNRVSSG